MRNMNSYYQYSKSNRVLKSGQYPGSLVIAILSWNYSLFVKIRSMYCCLSP
jgi:hypothetical protein